MNDARNRLVILALFSLCWCASIGPVAEGTSLSEQIQAWQEAMVEAQARMASLDPNGEAFAAAAEEFSVRGGVVPARARRRRCSRAHAHRGRRRRDPRSRCVVGGTARALRLEEVRPRR